MEDVAGYCPTHELDRVQWLAQLNTLGFSFSPTHWAGGEAPFCETESRQEHAVSADRLASQEKTAEKHVLSIFSKTHQSDNSILP